MARTAPKLPDYNVLTWVDPNDHDKGLMPIGGAWKSTSRDTGNEYISVRLNGILYFTPLWCCLWLAPYWFRGPPLSRKQ
jgi:uncharacterized protein (DUF736 family)